MADINPLSVGGASPQESRYPNLTTEELKIIGYFAQGQKHSISNKNLKLEYTPTSIRLSNINGKLLGISKQVNEWQRKVLIANNSAYRTNIVQILAEQGFIIKQKSSHPDFTEHHHYKIPDGYKLNYTETIQLWKSWWNNKRHQLNVTNIVIDLQVFVKGNWYPIEDLQPKQGNFAIQTLKGEIIIAPEHYIVWLDRRESEPLSPSIVTENPAARSSKNISSTVVKSPAIVDRLESVTLDEDLDLESYLNTFNTHDSEDVERIEGIYNINELLNETGNGEDRIPPSVPSSTIDRSTDMKSPTTRSLQPSNLERRQALKLKAIKTLSKYLQDGNIVTCIEVIKNNQGEEIERKMTTIQRGCPRWAISQIEQLKQK